MGICCCCCSRKKKMEGALAYQRNNSEVANIYEKSMRYSVLQHPEPKKFMADLETKLVKMAPSPKSQGDGLIAFSLTVLKNATRNFCPNDRIGEGGFGDVYMGWMDEKTRGAARSGHGIAVAVKKLKPDGFQGHKEWKSEVDYLGKLRHPNLVKLIGYCQEGENRLLVYEYMPKGSLESHLFQKEAGPMSWDLRIKVATGAARGLSFLHEAEQQIIYRDFKASNVLLDSEFNAKLSDFGLAKAGPTGNCTHVSTQVLGTHGYAAPEYIATGRLTARCDVYSFGVVLLELLTGRRALDNTKVGIEQNLVDWAKPYLADKRKMFRIMDTKLQGQYSQKGAFLVGLLAFECIGEAKLRPTMACVLSSLENLPGSKHTISPSTSVQSISPSMSVRSNPADPWSPLTVLELSPINKSPPPLPTHLNSPTQ